jgi:uncharacterized delta-60 repeat protein
LKKIVFFLFACLFYTASFAQSGQLDPTFGSGGKIIAHFQSQSSAGSSSVLQQDGKIISVGSTASSVNDLLVIRFNPNGQPDSTFGTNGFDTAHFSAGASASAAVIQPDKKIVVAGIVGHNALVIRYDSMGRRDSSFGVNGIANLAPGFPVYISSVALQHDGKIVLAGEVLTGQTAGGLLRLTSNGALDSTFGTSGHVIDTFYGMLTYYTGVAIQKDNKIIVGGTVSIPNDFTEFAITYAAKRYNENGTTDSTFNKTGTTFIGFSGFNDDQGWALALQPDGKILMTGYSNDNLYRIGVVRIDSDGANYEQTLTYNSDGCDGDAICLQPDGKIIVVGHTLDSISDAHLFILVRYNTDLSQDPSFGNGGIVTTDFGDGYDWGSGVLAQPDGKIVATGYSIDRKNFLVARYIGELTLGIINFKTDNNSVLIYPNPIKNSSTLDYVLTKNENITISLNDLSGRLVKNYIMNENENKGEHKTELYFDNNIAAGNYFLTLSDGAGKVSVKIIKQ